MPDNVRTSDIAGGCAWSASGMPWNRTEPGKERIELGLEWEKRWQAGEGRMNPSEPCHEIGSAGRPVCMAASVPGIRSRREGRRRALHRPHHIPNWGPWRSKT